MPGLFHAAVLHAKRRGGNLPAFPGEISRRNQKCVRLKIQPKEYPMKNLFRLFALVMAISVLISACGASPRNETTAANSANGKVVEYELMTNMVDGQMAFFGIGGGIEGV